jgi:hypothetical protein
MKEGLQLLHVIEACNIWNGFLLSTEVYFAFWGVRLEPRILMHAKYTLYPQLCPLAAAIFPDCPNI